MSICKNCNTEFDGGDFCPQCGTKYEEIEVSETVEEVVEEAVQNEEVVAENAPEVFTLPPQPEQTFVPTQPVQSTPKAKATINQAFSVIKNFFSKNIADAVTAQYEEKLHIWLILLALPAIFSAISGFIHYETPAVDFLEFFSAKYNIALGRFGYLVSGFLFALALEVPFVLGVYFYGKVLKKNLSLLGCANLVSSAFLPMTVISAVYVLCGSGVDIALLVAFGMFAVLLYRGVEKAFADKPVFWSFFLVVEIALAVFTVASTVISVPAWIIDAVSEATKPSQDIMNNYDYFSGFPFYY